MLGRGLEAVADLILSDMPKWAVDPVSGESLVWVEARLDHGPTIRAVELADGYLIRTRPDVIGIRMTSLDSLTILVRDYKSRGQVVDPAFDAGIIVRALWALAEIDNARCCWFLAGRQVDIDATTIELETVNLLHGDSEEFIIRRSLPRDELGVHRDRLTAQMLDMAVAAAAVDPNDVPASPSAFCLDWCPYLAKCQAGMDYVRKYEGAEPLELRLLQQAPS